jgi:hypothetical protein
MMKFVLRRETTAFCSRVMIITPLVFIALDYDSQGSFSWVIVIITRSLNNVLLSRVKVGQSKIFSGWWFLLKVIEIDFSVVSC